MRVILVTTLLAAAAAAEVITYEEFPADTFGSTTFPSDRYAYLGVTVVLIQDGATIDGLSNGDPGNWALEGTNGPTFSGFNGGDRSATFLFESPIVAFSLDIARGNGANILTDTVTLSSYLAGSPVQSITLPLGTVNDWQTMSLSNPSPIDEVRLQGSPIPQASIYSFGIDNLQWTRAFGQDLQIVEGNFTWHEAKADAEAKGGRLAVLNTQEKIDAANSYLEGLGFPNAWFGLTDEAEEGNWQWITGEPLTVSYWADGEPNNSFEHYGIYWGGKWNDGMLSHQSPYLLEILDQTPAAPFVALDPLYESPSGEAITLDATPTIGFPTEFTYQWCFNGFKIPAALGGTAETINIDNLTANEGTWSVTVTNETGSTESSFEYRLYADSDSDGLSDAYEELISETDINKPDTDDDGLSDGDEVNTYSTNPTLADTDSDGFDDLFEISTGFDPVSDISSPQAYSQILLAAEFRFNAATGVSYRIESSSDLENWEVIETGIIGAGARVTRLYTIEGTTQRFYRAGRE